MHRLPVDSSAIAAIGYDPPSRVLEIEFKPSGEVYRYFEVPVSQYRFFLESRSKGAYFSDQFKKAGYRYEKVE